ncbi:MAG: WD40 repeat domain-containing protein [Deltaproteobacteria bacterium]|nr:WD40 repeat domain-containing protein [Deltaproteobacteria bacterium]
MARLINILKYLAPAALILIQCNTTPASEVIDPSKIFKGHDSWVNDISAYNNTLYSVSNDGSLIEWDLKSGKIRNRIFLDKVKMLVREVVPHIYTISINKAGKLYGITSSDGYLRIRERSSHEELWKYKIEMENAYSLAFVNDHALLIGDISGTVTGVDIKKKKALYEIHAHVDAINEISLAPDGKSFATVSNDSLIRIWESSTGKRIKTIKGHKDSILSVDFSPDGTMLLTGSRDRTVRLWDVEEGDATLLHNDFSYINEVAFSPDGKRVAYQDNINNVTIKSVDTDKILYRLEGHEANVKKILFLGGAEKIITCSSDSNIIIWNTGGSK